MTGKNKAVFSKSKSLYFIMAWRSGNAFLSINEVTVRRIGLVIWWVTAHG